MNFAFYFFSEKLFQKQLFLLSYKRRISAAKFPRMKDCRETFLKQFSRENCKLSKPAENFDNFFAVLFLVVLFSSLIPLVTDLAKSIREIV